ILLTLLAAMPSRAQKLTSSASDSKSNPAQAKARKKHVPERTFVLDGAGDIASCQHPEGARATAKLIEQIPGTVFAAGDLAYEEGSAEDFQNCYDPTWGRFKDRTKPALGNHEYVDRSASGDFQSWGSKEGTRGKAYASDTLARR